MKAILFATLALFSFCTLSRAEPPSAYAMQKAIMVDQDVRKVEEYLKAGFDPKSPIGCGTFDALDGAVHKQNAEMAALLIRHGAKPKEGAFVQAAIGASHAEACKIVQLFLEAGADVNSKSRYSLNQSMYWTALHYAIFRENVDLVRLLLSQKKISVNDVDGDGKTPLQIAGEKGNKQLVEMLVQAGAK
jgi:ankyrin repeat protein